MEPPPPATEPVREPEKRDDPNTIAGGTIGGATPAPRELAPGQLTDEQLLQALTPPAGPKPAVVELPFTDDRGQPILQIRPARTDNRVMLPFPDASGNPIEIVAPPGPRIPFVDFTTPPPGTPGKTTPAVTVPTPGPTNPADARGAKGGGGGGNR